MTSFRDFLEERKQVGIIYHFTTIDAIKKLSNKEYMKTLGCDIFTFLSYNTHFSTTRDYALVNLPYGDFTVSKYNIRIALDGDKISDKYKIKPINGLIDNNPKVFGTEFNDNRVPHKSEKEEIILCPKSQSFELKDYIKEIQVYLHNKDDAEDVKKYLDDTLKVNKLNIPVNLVRKWKPLKEDTDNVSNINECFNIYHKES